MQKGQNIKPAARSTRRTQSKGIIPKRSTRFAGGTSGDSVPFHLVRTPPANLSIPPKLPVTYSPQKVITPSQVVQSSDTARRGIEAAGTDSSQQGARPTTSASTSSSTSGFCEGDEDLLLVSSSFNIRTVIRFRPPLEHEEADSKGPWAIGSSSVADSKGTTFHYDNVFSEKVTNADVYNDSCKDIVHACLRGFNGTIFAYGQTSSGKTHTMLGDIRHDPGVIPLALSEIFDKIEKIESRRFTVSLSYLEVYNEKLIDLLLEAEHAATRGATGTFQSRGTLATGGGIPTAEISILETGDGNVELQNLSSRPMTCTEDLYNALETSQRVRHIAATGQNEQSSRSHTVLRLRVESSTTELPNLQVSPRNDGGLEGEADDDNKENSSCTDEDGEKVVDEAKADFLANSVRVGYLYLVDLAGSEQLNRAKTEGQRRREGKNINQSLLALSNVITALADKQEAERKKGKPIVQHISYRNSKLTRLLQNSLGGNSRTAVICNCAPGTDNYAQTWSTLEFGKKAKSIKNRSKINFVLSANVGEHRALKAEIAQTYAVLEKTEKSEANNVRIMEKIRELSQLILPTDSLSCLMGSEDMSNQAGCWRPSPCSFGVDTKQREVENVIRLEKELEVLRAEKQVLEKRDVAAVQQASTAEAVLSETRENVNRLQKEQEALRAEKESEVERLKQLLGEGEAAAAQQASTAEAALSETRENVNRLQKHLEDSEASTEELRAEKQVLEEGKAAAVEQASTAEAALSETRENVNRLQKELLDSEASTAALRAENESEVEKLKQLLEDVLNDTEKRLRPRRGRK